jgi:hypothetical protein
LCQGQPSHLDKCLVCCSQLSKAVGHVRDHTPHLQGKYQMSHSVVLLRVVNPCTRTLHAGKCNGCYKTAGMQHAASDTARQRVTCSSLSHLKELGPCDVWINPSEVVHCIRKLHSITNATMQCGVRAGTLLCPLVTPSCVRLLITTVGSQATDILHHAGVHVSHTNLEEVGHHAVQALRVTWWAQSADHQLPTDSRLCCCLRTLPSGGAGQPVHACTTLQ